MDLKRRIREIGASLARLDAYPDSRIKLFFNVDKRLSSMMNKITKNIFRNRNNELFANLIVGLNLNIDALAQLDSIKTNTETGQLLKDFYRELIPALDQFYMSALRSVQGSPKHCTTLTLLRSSDVINLVKSMIVSFSEVWDILYETSDKETLFQNMIDCLAIDSAFMDVLNQCRPKTKLGHDVLRYLKAFINDFLDYDKEIIEKFKNTSW